MKKGISSQIEFSHFLMIPNLITMARALLALPMYLALKEHNLYLVTFYIFVAIASDYLDGIMARRRNEITELGKILDPIADKFFIGLSTYAMMKGYGLPLWLGYSIIIRDILIVTGSFLLAGRIKKINPSNMIGKITVNVLAVTIIFYIYGIPYLIDPLTWLSLAFIILSLLNYLVEGIRKMKQ